MLDCCEFDPTPPKSNNLKCIKVRGKLSFHHHHSVGVRGNPQLVPIHNKDRKQIRAERTPHLQNCVKFCRLNEMRSLLMWAAAGGHPRWLALAVRAGGDVNRRAGGDVNRRAGGDVNRRAEAGRVEGSRTPLIAAAEHGHTVRWEVWEAEFDLNWPRTRKLHSEGNFGSDFQGPFFKFATLVEKEQALRSSFLTVGERVFSGIWNLSQSRWQSNVFIPAQGSCFHPRRHGDAHSNPTSCRPNLGPPPSTILRLTDPLKIWACNWKI